MKNTLLALLLLLGTTTFAQNKKLNLDSLNQIWLDETQPDTMRFQAYKDFIWKGYLFSNPDTAFILSESLKQQATKKENKKWEAEAIRIQGVSYHLRGNMTKALEYYILSLKIFEEIGDKNGIANSLNNIGLIYYNQGETAKALDNYTRSLKIREELGDKNGIAGSLNNIGNIYNNQGESSKALDYYIHSLNILEEIGDKSGLAASLNNIGLLYGDQGETTKALENYTRCLEIYEELGNKSGIAKSLGNIGLIYRDQGESSKAIDYCTSSLKILEELGDKNGIATTLGNIGTIYKNQGESSKALDYYTRSMKILEEIGDKIGIARTLNNIGIMYYDQGNLKEALAYSKKSMTFAQELGATELIKDAANTLSEIYEKQGEGMKTLEMYKLHIQMRDSIQSEEAQKGLLKMEVQHQFEKDQIVKKQAGEEAARIEAEKIAQRNSLQYSGIGFGIFAIFGLVFFLGRVQLPKWAVELSVFLPFLIFFEFLLVITDDSVEAWSGGEPLVKLLLNVVMAGAIFPLHSFFEKFLKKRLFKARYK